MAKIAPCALANQIVQLSQGSHSAVRVQAKSQGLAGKLAALARVACVHGAYPGQVATAGSFAMPLAPLHILLGQISEPAKVIRSKNAGAFEI